MKEEAARESKVDGRDNKQQKKDEMKWNQQTKERYEKYMAWWLA